MDFLYASSRSFQHDGDHDGVGDVHESSGASVVPRYRRAYGSGAASGLHHSFPLVICRVGLIHDAEHQRLLPGLAKQVKLLEESEEDRNKSDGLSAVSATTTVGGRSHGSDAGGPSHDNTSIAKVNQSRLGSGYGSPVLEGAANLQSKPCVQPAALSKDQIIIQGMPLEDFVSHVAQENINLFIKDFISNLIKTIIGDLMKEYVKAIFRALVKAFVKHFTSVPSREFIDDILSGLIDELPTSGFYTDRPITESHREEQKPPAHPIEDKVDAAEVPLPPSPSLTPLNNRSRIREYSAASATSSFEKRPRDDSDEDITELPIRTKKARSRKQKLAKSVQRREADSIDFVFLAEASDRSSSFDVSRWSIVDWQNLTFASRNAQDPHLNAETSLAATNVQSASMRSAPLYFISIIQPALRQPNTSAKSFVSAIQKFNELVAGCDALDRFRKIPNRCLANDGYGTRCNSWDRLPIEVQPIVEKLLADLARLNFDSWPLYCVYNLVIFTNIAVCRYQRSMIRNKVAALRQLRYLERPYDTELVRYLPQFLPYRPPESAGLTVNQFILQVAREPPKIDDSKKLGEGYLYVYWNEATFGVRKIGFTTWEVSDRLKQWEKDCKHVATEQYRSPYKVRYAAKVEQLVHADLMDYRVYEPACRACFKSHIEWFRGVDLTFIIERIKAWSQWISEEPYQIVDGQWRLTPEAEEGIHVVRAPNNCPDAEVQSKSLVNHPRRYNLRRAKGRKPCE